MNNKHRFIKKRLSHVIAATLAASMGATAFANDFTIQDGQLRISSGAFDETVTVGANGVITKPGDNVPVSDNFGIPDFDFTLVNTADTKTDGTYTFEVGVAITDDNTNRRIEAYLGQLNLVVGNNGTTLTGSIPSQDLVVLARDGAVNASAVLNNAATNGPISISDGNVSFSGARLVSRLKAANSAFDTILDAFDAGGHYTYRVVIEQTSANTATRFGIGNDAGSFSALPRVQTTCAEDANSQLGSVFQLLGSVNNAAYRVNEQLSLAYAVQGQFSVVGAAGAAGAAPTAFTETCAAAPVNTAPTAADAAFDTAFETELTGNLPAATDGQNDAITYALALAAAEGTATVNGDGSFTYQPDDDFSGNDTFQYSVSDGTLSTTYTVTVTVAEEENTAPIADGLAVNTGFNEDISGTLPTATDAQDDDITYALVDGSAVGGTAAVTEGGGYSFSPTAGFSGAGSFQYTVSDGELSNTYTVNVTVAAPPNTMPTISDMSASPGTTFVDTDGQDGEEVTVTIVATDPEDNIATYDWSGSDGVSLISESGDSAIFRVPNDFSVVSVTVTDSGGLADTRDLPFDIGPPIPPTAAIAGDDRTQVDTNGVVGETLSVSGTVGDTDGTVASVRWLLNGVERASSAAPNLDLTPEFVFTTDGDKEITLEATDNVGLITTSAPITIRVQPPVRPIVSVVGGSREIVDTDGEPGETVPLIGTAFDPDGPDLEVASTEWRIGGVAVAQGLEADISVPDGVTSVVFAAEDTQGLEQTTTIQVRAFAPQVPVVTINGGNRTRVDTDGEIGETLNFTATAADTDGQIAGYQWSVGGTEVDGANEATAALTIPAGESTVSVVVVDNVGLISEPATVAVTIGAPEAPQVSIVEGDIEDSADTDAPFDVTLTADAFDVDGNVVELVWSSTGEGIAITPAADGLSATVTITPPVTDGTVSVTATDNVGLTATATSDVNVAVTAIPVVDIEGGDRAVADTDGEAGETVSVSATATATIGDAINPEWVIGGEVVETGLTADLSLADGPNTVTFRATAEAGGEVRSESVVITVQSALPNVAPTISVAGPASVLDTDGKAGETATFTATAVDPDADGAEAPGPVSLIRWEVNGVSVATGAEVGLNLVNGENTVQAIAIDKLGAQTAADPVTVTVGLPTAPTVAIAVDTPVTDTDGKAGEIVNVAAVDIVNQYPGTVTAQWLVGGTVVAHGLTAALQLPNDGPNDIAVRVRNSVNLTGTATGSVTVLEPIAPVVAIIGGDQSFEDTDSRAGEAVSLLGQASDADGPDGNIAVAQWLLNGQVIANDVAADVRLPDGENTIVFRATDFQGLSTQTSAVYTVATFIPPPTEAEVVAETQAQNERADAIAALLQTDPEAAAAAATQAAEEAKRGAEQLRRGLDSGTASNSSIVSGLGALSRASSTSSTAAAGSSNQATRQAVKDENKAILRESGELLERMADNSQNNDVVLSQEESDQLKQATSNLLDTTASMSEEIEGTDELLEVVASANRVIENNQRLGIAADPVVAEKTKTASVAIATKVIDQVLQELGETGVSTEEIRQALSQNDAALQSVINSALKIPATTVKSPVDRKNDARERLGGDAPASLVDRLAAATNNVVNPRNIAAGGVSALDAILALFTAGGAPVTFTLVDNEGRILSVANLEDGEARVDVDDATGAVTINVPGETYAGVLVAVRAVPDTVPEGIRFRQDGSGLIVNNGFAMEIAPAPIDLIKFGAAVEGAGFPFSFRTNATVSLDVGNGERFSGAFAYDNLVGIDLTACGDLSFVEPVGEINSAGYAFAVRCANGATQRIVPFIESTTFAQSVGAFGLTLATDRNTGFVTVQTVGTFKPSFFVTPRTAAERVYHATNKDAFGQAYQTLDINGDGKMDVKLISNTGTQILYGVN